MELIFGQFQSWKKYSYFLENCLENFKFLEIILEIWVI